MDARVKLLTGYILMMNIAACNDTTGGAEKTTEAVAAPTETKELVLDKLVGLWKSEDGMSFEQWDKNADSTYQTRAYSIKGLDTSWNEQASIYPKNDSWIFENTVKGQNDGKAVKFTSTILNERTVQFSNPQHDFPTDVNYTVSDANTLNAFIIGPNKRGGKDTIPFNYTRIK
ncbi:MAG TPA: hypothetical protein VFH08_14805 [Chitinophagaceae bacterium]|nr:hypothetical protein [Chitinophagaceae bacterium]